MRVVIYHNVARDERGRPLGMLDGYRPEHPITPVAAYDVDGPEHEPILDNAWRLFNVGDDPAFGEPDPRAVAYRQRHNRSLSEGDVVSIADATSRTYYCAVGFGWRLILTPRIKKVTLPGTTPIDLSS